MLNNIPHPILEKPFVVNPQSACAETYIVAGVYEKSENLCTYISARLFRCLVLLNKPTQDATAKVYTFVPVQNFNESWSDEKLYKKYGLDEDEIKFIESMIKPMEL